MGRKKIEIKPLTDERNRNVTFLKRKAGLMKKAYELSVLCGVSVSILIFGANGKPYEFSSADFDTEVDRYYDYEGAIERRRAAEFEAMALAGEDASDDDDERAKKPAVSKSLKGKESFKTRRIPRSAERERDRDRERRRHREPKVDDSFVGGLVEETQERPESPTAASLNYAMSMHQAPAPAPPAAWPQYRPQPLMPFNTPTYMPSPSINPGGGGGGGGGPGWDGNMLTTYAWLQIQQAHQEQKRALLEKQQHQLLELTSRTGGHAFIRDMLGVGVGGGGSSGTGSSSSNSHEFVWPTAPDPGPGTSGVSTPPDEDLIWALGGGMAGPSTAAPPGPGPSVQPVPANMPSWRVDPPRPDERALKRMRQ
ncbi:hypothetical protein CspeluHIS016_0701760 [Cutaneotrichosporon spelunceum]|uniref:MADS-box domain-containing protein n=1 Tax=Cutaneotrichosporon spelunceum TaxID=1672016 RepID=A0AAD3TZ14_9TREE|nr:hypothetical protein CspeluHIS016_0701760 [Cutaneotrichosporon spelunceum]